MWCIPISLAALFIFATNACVLPERKAAAALAASLPLTNSMPTTRSYKVIRSPTCNPKEEPSVSFSIAAVIGTVRCKSPAAQAR